MRRRMEENFVFLESFRGLVCGLYYAFTVGWILYIIDSTMNAWNFIRVFYWVNIWLEWLRVIFFSKMINMTRNIIKIFSHSPNTRNILFLFWIFHRSQLNFLENVLPSIVTTDFLLSLAALRPSVNTYLINSLLSYCALYVFSCSFHVRANFLFFFLNFIQQTFNSLFNEFIVTIYPHFPLSRAITNRLK